MPRKYCGADIIHGFNGNSGTKSLVIPPRAEVKHSRSIDWAPVQVLAIPPSVSFLEGNTTLPSSLSLCAWLRPSASAWRADAAFFLHLVWVLLSTFQGFTLCPWVAQEPQALSSLAFCSFWGLWQAYSSGMRTRKGTRGSQNVADFL